MESFDVPNHPHPSPLPEGEGTRPRHRYGRSARLSGKLQFSAVYDAKTKTTAGPLVIFSKPNGCTHHRLGLSVSRRVGNAVQRNRIKRLLREAFRLEPRRESAAGFDLVIVARPHTPAALVQYQQWLSAAALRIAKTWRDRAAPSGE